MANGNSDIKLVHGQVKVEAWDLCVDSNDRRKTNTPFRRALVHDFSDGLTVNWANDYSGGVTINGLKQINAKPPHTMQSPSTVNLTISGSTQIEGFFLKILGDLSVSGLVKIASNAQFDKDLTIDGNVKLKKNPPPGSRAPAGWSPYYDLHDAIRDLEARVAALEKK